MRTRVLIFLFCPCILLSSTWNWRYISSENFDGYYKKGDKDKAIKGLYFLEKHKAKVDSLVGFSKTGSFNLGSYILEIPTTISEGEYKQRIPIVFQNMGVANGYADPTMPKISLFHSGMKADGFVWGENWYRMVAVHEYTHIAQMSPRKGNLATAIFGYWLSPNIYQPLWILEGYTVYSESQISPNEGRLNNGAYHAIAKSQKFFGTTPSLMSLTYHDYKDFPPDAQYLYGGILTDYLSQTYGEKSLTMYNNLVEARGVGGVFNVLLPNFYMDRAAKKVFGEKFHSLYKKAIDNLPEVEINTDLELQGQKKGNVHEFVVEDGECYYTVGTYDFSGSSVSELYCWKNGESEFIKNFISADDYSFQLSGKSLYYKKYVFKSGFANIDEMGTGVSRELYVYDLARKKEKLVLPENIESFFVDEQKNIYYTKERKDSYGSELYLKKVGENPQLLMSTDMSISQLFFAEGLLILTAKSELGSLGLYSWKAGEENLKMLINSKYAEIYPSVKAGKLYFTANYDKNISGYCYDLQSAKLTKITDADFAKATKVDGEFAYYLGLGKDGYRVCRSEIKNRTVALPPNSVDEKLDISTFEYVDKGGAVTRNLASLLIPPIRTPLIQQGTDLLGSTNYVMGIGDFFFLNAFTTFFDPLIINFSVSPNKFYGVSGLLPVYTSYDFGLSNIYLLLGYEFDNEESEKTIDSKESYFTGVNFVFNLPHDYLSLTSTFDDDEDVDCNLIFNHYFRNSQLGFAGSVKKIADKNLLWYQMEKEANLFYLQKICDVKKGLWSPSLYMRDLNLKFFVDYDKDELSKDSYELDTKFGVGLVSNLATMMGNISANLEVGSCWEKKKENEDYQPEIYFNFLFFY